jgi:ABC-2 type transport system permease protein
MIRGIYAIILLDLKRTWIDRMRIITGVAQPLLYLFVLGAGLGGNTRGSGADYQRFIFPGVVGLALLFSSVFAAIIIVFDRQVGFLKAVLVSPLPRSAIAAGKILSGAIQALIQGVILIPFAMLVGIHLGPLETLELLGAMILGAVTFSAMGVAAAARFTSTTVFPIISNALLLPMFFMSGAMYPISRAPHWMQVATHFDPVAYSVDLMRRSLLGQFYFPPFLSVAVQLVLVLILGWMCVGVFNRGEDDSALGETRFKWRR